MNFIISIGFMLVGIHLSYKAENTRQSSYSFNVWLALFVVLVWLTTDVGDGQNQFNVSL